MRRRGGDRRRAAGIVHPRIERLAGDGDAVVVTVQLGGARHLVSVRMDPSDPDVSSS